MNLIYENDKFIAVSTYDERRIPKEAAFRWDPVGKKWWTSSVENAAKLIEYADEETKRMIDEAMKVKQETYEASRASDANIDIPKPEGLEYLPFQKAGIAFSMNRKNTMK